MSETLIKGDWGESAACDYLEAKGYLILKRNFRCRLGEIDIIAQCEDGAVSEQIVMAEVKCRASKIPGFPTAAECVSPAKQKKIKQAARFWLLKEPYERYIRFDVIEVYGTPERGVSEINHIIGAFS